MLNTAHRITDESLVRLHRRVVSSKGQIRDLLQRARRAEVALYSGVNRELGRESARIVEIEKDAMSLDAVDLDMTRRSRMLLNLELEGHSYIFSVPVLGGKTTSLSVGIPDRMYLTERRDRPRHGADQVGVPGKLELEFGGARSMEATVLDYSVDGAAVLVPAEAALPGRLVARPWGGPDSGESLTARVRSRGDVRDGWSRVGLSLSAAEPENLMAPESGEHLFEASGLRSQVKGAIAGLRVSSHRLARKIMGRSEAPPKIVEISNEAGEVIRGLIDRVGNQPRSPVVLMPPAFAKTKETLLPLARTIVQTFEASGQPVVVLRTDGIRRRGESHNDPDCRSEGKELHNYTYSQGVSDIQAILRFLRDDPRFLASKVVIVSFSSASIEARRAIARDQSGIIAGWISVVGAADLKGGWQVLSGGVDYIGGFERGLRFGIQKVLGIEGDIDRIAADAIESRLAYAEDARRDMRDISVPVTWLRGTYDAWIDPDRVQELMSVGDATRRRLIEVPTGHQLRTSSEAFGTFRLVAEEASRFLLERRLKGVEPDWVELDRRAHSERRRRPSPDVDLKGFWHDYMLGEDERIGMDILIETSTYQSLLRRQVEAVGLTRGDRVGDVGSGTGALLDFLSKNGPSNCVVHELDFVRKALTRARGREVGGPCAVEPTFTLFDLAVLRSNSLPWRTGCMDAVFASLVLNYVREPDRLLAEVYRVLRSGGRFVFSSLRRDADVSRIYNDASGELRGGAAGRSLGLSPSQVDDAIGQFLNQVGRLLDLEELDIFRTWSRASLRQMVERAGFVGVEVERVFGEPAQAIMISCSKP